MEIYEGLCHPGNKKAAFVRRFFLLSDIPSHFNLGKARTPNIKGFAQESEREKETWNTGPTSTIARVLLSTALFEVNLPL